MAINENLNKINTRFIYIRSTKEQIPCTEQEFHDFYHDIDNYRRKQQRHGRCVCPASKRLECDMDCLTCPFQREGDFLSLDNEIDDDGEAKTHLENLTDRSPLIEDMITENARFKELFARLNELMPQAVDIGVMRQNGVSDTAISAQIGIPRKTFTDRIKRAKGFLEKEFPEYF